MADYLFQATLVYATPPVGRTIVIKMYRVGFTIPTVK
jgi:hypothetical protein